jgi:outer membrane receptor protein involved in Fe transport
MHLAKRTVAAALACTLLLLIPAVARAQSRVTGADLEGVVRDETGALVGGVAITAVNVDTMVPRTTVTDSSGRYLLPAVSPGVYTVTAELFGFAGQARENVPLLLGQSARVDFALKLSGVMETIVVGGTLPVLDTRRTVVAYTVGESQIRNLPINGRNFISFSLITPGVTADRLASGLVGTSGLSFTGQSSRANNIMVDGFDNNDAGSGGVRGLFSQEAIREFQVLTDSYSAEFGQASGGVVNIVTRGGTNELHGEAFAFFRDDALNARDYFEKYDVHGGPVDRPKADFRQWQGGATLGGPLRHGHTFFFLSYERSDTRAHNFVNIEPAAAAALGAAGFPVELGNVPYRVDSHQALARIDHQWSPRSSLTVRGSLLDLRDENADAFGGIVARSAAAALERTDWFVSAAQTDVLSARWLNEARVQYAHFLSESLALDPSCDGPCDGNDEGGPMVVLPGVATAGRSIATPLVRPERRWRMADTLSFYGGDHLIKGGAEFEITRGVASKLPYYFGGQFIFAPLPGSVLGLLGLPPRQSAISPVEALLLGLPAANVQGYGDPDTTYQTKELSAFLQDEWRVSSRFTLRTGLRYQRQIWSPRVHVIPDVGGSTFTYDVPRDTNDFAPRLGLSFDARGDGRTVLRLGYGLYYADHVFASVTVPDVIDGAEHVRVYSRLLPDAAAAWRRPGHEAPESAAAVPNIVAVDPGMKSAFTHQASFGFDQALGADFALSLNALYVRGYNALGQVDYNPLVPALGPGRRPNDANGRPFTSAPLQQYTSFGESWYKGLTVALSKRFSHGHEFLLSYTLSKAENTTDDVFSQVQDQGLGRNPADPLGLPLGFDASREKGPSQNDQRHRAVLSGVFGLPWSLRLSTVVSAESGRPFTPLAGVDLNGDGVQSDRARTDPRDPASSVGRNSELTEAHFNADVRLTRRFGMGAASVEAIAEVFNVFNTVNFVQPNATFGPGAFPGQPLPDASGRSTYGLYQKALAPRQVQLALKVGF